MKYTITKQHENVTSDGNHRYEPIFISISVLKINFSFLTFDDATDGYKPFAVARTEIQVYISTRQSKYKSDLNQTWI